MKYNNPSLNIASDIHYQNDKFENYTFECIDNKKYIVGEKYSEIPKTKNYIIDDLHDEIVKTDLLFDIIKLKQKLPNFNLPYDELGDERNLNFVDDLIDKKNINIIIKFCKKHGMLFTGNFHFNTFWKSTPLNLTETIHFEFDHKHNTRILFHKYSLRIGAFVIVINLIYQAFICGLILNNDEIINNSNGDIALTLDTIYSQFKHIKKSTAEQDFKEIIKYMDIYLQPVISKNMKTHTYKIYGKTLLSCALYQLLQFITSSNKKIKTCDECYTIFIASRKDVRFCSGACRVKYCRTHPNKKTR